MKILISKIGELQRKDIERGSGIIYGDFARISTILDTRRSIGDRSPHRMAELFGGSYKYYNHHFIIQTAGCPLACWYCYVDNLAVDAKLSASELVDLFMNCREKAKKDYGIDVNVLHFMGGAPAVYSYFWKIIRDELDSRNLHDVILFSNVIFVEYHTHYLKPWEFMSLDRFIVEGCLKGTTRQNFLENTGWDLFHEAVSELGFYTSFRNIYLTLLEHDENAVSWLYKMFDPSRVDVFQVVKYETVEIRLKK